MTSTSIIFLIIAVIATLAAVAILDTAKEELKFQKFRREEQWRKNVRLEDSITELKAENLSLRESLRNNHNAIAGILATAAATIADSEALRKKLLRRLKDRKPEELTEMLRDTDDVRRRYREFHDSLDDIVAGMFPDLAEDGVRPLSTRRRIEALNRLDITKSGDVAAILNLSVRTVYNNRSMAATASGETVDAAQ